MESETNLKQRMTGKKKSGYLDEDFRLFHITSKETAAFDFHYHDFHKIVIPISGQVSYILEGKTYHLNPWDILLVSRYDVHRPVISETEDYDRIIIWIQNQFAERNLNQPGSPDLSDCFREAKKRGFQLVHPDLAMQETISYLISQLENSIDSQEYGSALLSTTLFQQIMIYINRIFMEQNISSSSTAITYDKGIEAILQYINENLTQTLSIEQLSARFYLSKYHLMHKFKKTTGFTLHYYIEQKRLVLASAAIRNGVPVMKAAQDSGFYDYSTFLRAFRKKYQISPTEFIRRSSQSP